MTTTRYKIDDFSRLANRGDVLKLHWDILDVKTPKGRIIVASFQSLEGKVVNFLEGHFLFIVNTPLLCGGNGGWTRQTPAPGLNSRFFI